MEQVLKGLNPVTVELLVLSEETSKKSHFLVQSSAFTLQKQVIFKFASFVFRACRPSWWLVNLCSCATGCPTWMGPVCGLSPSAHVPQVAPLGWAQLMACQPLFMCHRLHHLDGSSWWLVTLCSCATGCTTWWATTNT